MDQALSQRQHELIDKYLEADLTPDEESELRSYAQEDPAFREWLDWYIQLGPAAGQHLREADPLKRLLIEEEKKIAAADRPALRPVHGPSRYRWVGVAAAVLLVIAAAWWALQPPAAPNYEAIAGSLYDQSIAVLGGVMSDETDAPGPFEAAKKAIRNGEYDLAQSRLKRYAPSDSAYAEARYLLGHTHFQTGDYAAAALDFQTVLQPSYLDALPATYGGAQDVAWLRLLALVGSGDGDGIAAALRAFETTFPNMDPYYRDQLSELKKQISSNE